MKPFYSKALNAFVMDAVCECGHLESEHGSQMKRVDNIFVRDAHSGGCRQGCCQCPQFQWERWYTLDEQEARVTGRVKLAVG